MPVLHPYREKHKDLSVGDLELEAKPDEGFEIMELGIHDSAQDCRGQLIIGEENILNFNADSEYDEVAPVPLKGTNLHTLLKTIREKYPDVPSFKVGVGEKLILSATSPNGVAYVFYRHLTGAEIPPKTDPGGSESMNRLQLFPSEVTDTIPATGSKVLIVDTDKSEKGFKGFVYPDKVPDGVTYRLLGFCINKGRGSHADTSITSVRIWKQNKSILCPDEEWSDAALYPFNVFSINKPFFLLPEPIDFVTGEDMKVELDCANANAADQDIYARFTPIVHQIPT